jgi:uncharacterized protein
VPTYVTADGRFEWDTVKAGVNLRRHQLPFGAALTLFDDPFHEFELDPDPDEERWRAIGMAGTRCLTVVYVWRGSDDIPRIRLISARRATPHERDNYLSRRQVPRPQPG